MKLNLTFLVVLFIILVAVHCADTDLEVKKNTHDDLGSKTTTSNRKVGLNDKSSTSGSNLESEKADASEKAKFSNDIPNASVDKTKSVPSKLLGDGEAGNVKTDSKDKEVVEDVEKKSIADKGSKSKNVPEEEKLSSMRKGSFRDEQCDSSFKCTIGSDENHEMVACLSVPGDDSTEVSLLIQNKGKGLLDVDINAPDFVRLEKTKIQIQENDDQKVMVSIGDGKTERLITLKTHKGNCSLDFMDFLTHNPMKKSNYMSQLTFTNLFRRTPFLGLISLAFLLIIASVLVCVTYQRRRFLNNGTKYQKLDAELPVSGGPKTDFDQKGGWDDNWSDDWDDVEAPSTPSMPLTPSISSAGVSSRRVNKDAWKD
ncbi:uncharacterized protein LOC112527631 [Cynara cardunculus var. scolymus]|uniref:DUF7356 domain-containing protein n=1 Tax=Cynara cardunculus var. scolymus TaxID=59895 RepID=A0A103XR61_CYNCS|nr:uncharacterized protein LOC112527631 [Cynara cardunculus var. scolymus]XP_024994146.1 uncharacterized protein LOC112527631 [Cynara cardunculus var. scolymus]KVH95345.1 hypothetical protein Ccrd_002596 [Cynara cardunculus var. scolymus]